MEVMEKFEARTGARIAEAYGMTEASSVTHVNPRKGQRKFGSIGVPIIGTDAKIVDSEDWTKELDVGEVGELMIKGPQVMQGYWNASEETADAISAHVPGVPIELVKRLPPDAWENQPDLTYLMA